MISPTEHIQSIIKSEKQIITRKNVLDRRHLGLRGDTRLFCKKGLSTALPKHTYCYAGDIGD